MYTKFFGLNEKPFSITPDPRYLFMSERHSEGLAHLVYGVKESSGFIQLTGEVGTGKTTLVRTLLTRIPKGVDVALVLNPQLSATEFLTAICEELKITLPEERASSKALVDALNKHLLESHAAGRRTILIIDEAQNLATDVLEQVRLLTNLETAKQKLLQIILIAQPELRDKLSQTNLRQLAQRVTGRYHLEPLSREETAQYIDHRMKVAGGLTEVFEERAKREVYKQSGGVPRLINVICDRALLGAFSKESRTVDAALAREAANEVSGERPKQHRWLLPAVGLLTVAVVAGGLWALFGSRPQATAPSEVAAPVEVAPQEATEQPEPVAVEERPSLDAQLMGLPGRAGADAMQALMALWGIEYDSSAGDACSQVEAAGLSCLRQRGSLSMLRKLDRPVVLRLTDSDGRKHDLVLASMRDDDVELIMDGSRVTTSVDEIADLWFGLYQLIWHPPNGDPSVLRRGVQGPKVVWLRQSLAALDPNSSVAPGDSPLFDGELEQQLLDFQRRNRLDTDGLAGQQTQIIINSQLGLDGRPRLSGG